ncbi:MAG TPA: type VI secretion system accessory protein TagJ [Bryobacteraceae bacterium]|nr:type VI secretion system accessory protein TagJ [Bryobacteraceae bacterium]
MTAQELFKAGKLQDAIQALSVELRDNPTDNKRRTFLFELLCFAGDFDRARKHLELLAKENQKTGMGALLMEACMHAERTRNEIFEKKDYPSVSAGPARAGTMNGQPFKFIEDADPRIGARLEVFTAGAYIWIPLEHIDSIETQPPKRLRDLLWAPVIIHTAESFKQTELGECLLPVLSPFSYKHPNDNVKLGRESVWEHENGEDVPYGQKMFLVDGEDIPLLDIRKIEFEEAEEAAGAATVN